MVYLYYLNQWGAPTPPLSTISETDYSVTFATSFPSAAVSALAISATLHSNSYNEYFGDRALIHTLTKTGMNLYGLENSSKFYYIALGY